MKKIILILRAGLQETFTDKKIIVLLLIIGFIIDNGVRQMVNHALQVGQPLGVFEGFIMCVNHWYYLVAFLIGFIFILAGVPRINSEQILLIYRTGKRNWLLVKLCKFLYVLSYIYFFCLFVVFFVVLNTPILAIFGVILQYFIKQITKCCYLIIIGL